MSGKQYRRPDSLATGASDETEPPAPGRIQTGIPWLDLILPGGIPENRAHLVVGSPGTGKTTLGLQFLLEGRARGERTLFITLAESRQELESSSASHDWDLDGIDILEVVSSEEHDRPEQDYTALHPAEIELGESFDRMVETVQRVKPRRVVMDSLTEIRLLAREPVRYRRQIIALKNFLVGSGCTVLFIDDPLGGQDGQLQTICHGVIAMEKLAPEYGRERRRLQVMKMRSVQFHGGYHDYTIRKGGLVIWPRLVAAKHGRKYPIEPVSSGVKGIDAMLGGGPDRGTSMLIVGAAGTGKSSLCSQYCLAAARRNDYFACFSFDERLATIQKRNSAMGLDLDAIIAAGRGHVEQVDPGELSPGEFMQRVRRQVEKFDARIVVIDSLSGYLAAMPGEQYLVIQMHELLTYLSRMGVLTLAVVAQHGLVGAQLGPTIDLSYLADTVVFMRYFEYAGAVHRAISVVKKRGARHEATIREAIITQDGVQLGDPLTEFQGVLSGEPQYIGGAAPLLRGTNAAQKS